MTATAQMRGHPVYFDGSVWRYSDDNTLAPASGGEERPCVKCGRVAEGDYGPDPCLGWIEGVSGACCGHGIEREAAGSAGAEGERTLRAALTDALDYWWNFDEESGQRRTSHADLVSIIPSMVAEVLARRMESQGWAQSEPPQALDSRRLAEADHEWSRANANIRCAAHYVPVRPCTPDDHMEWAFGILARLAQPSEATD